MSVSISSSIPGAQLAVVEGESAEIFNCDMPAIVSTIEDFIGVVATNNSFDSASSDEPELPPELTNRELEIIQLLVAGLRSKEIGSRLGLSTHTVERHIANLYRKTGVNGRVALTVFALRHGLNRQTIEPVN